MTTWMCNAQHFDPTERAFSGVDLYFDETQGDVRWMGPSGKHPKDLKPPAADAIDAGGLWLLPGLVDLRVHGFDLRQAYRESAEATLKAAALGGVTTMLPVPLAHPGCDREEGVQALAAMQAGFAGARLGISAALSPNFKGEGLAPFAGLMRAGALWVSDFGSAPTRADVLRSALTYATDFDLTVCLHPREPALEGVGVMHEGSVSARLGLMGVPAAAEEVAIARIIALIRLTGGRVHVGGLSSAQSVKQIAAAKKEGLPITCDVAVHQLLWDHTRVEGYGSEARLEPPLRDQADMHALREGVWSGIIDAVVSDHRPQSTLEKEVPFAEAKPGVVGMQTLLPGLLAAAAADGVAPEVALPAVTLRPGAIVAQALGKRVSSLVGVGELRAGGPADMVLFDPKQTWQLTAKMARTWGWAQNSLFLEETLQGQVMRTWCGGHGCFDVAESVCL